MSLKETGTRGWDHHRALCDTHCADPQELEDDAIYSVHVPAGLYRVSRAGGSGSIYANRVCALVRAKLCA